MKYLELTDLPELTREADRAQSFLTTTMDDLERMPPTSIEFRLKALDKITDFIYRLTAVRKTLAALRASFTVNTNGLRALTEMMRTLHAQMGDIQMTMNTQRTPRMRQPDFALKLPADWNLGFKRFSPDWPPTEDELIPEPTLLQGGGGVPPLMNPAAAPASADEVAQAFQPAHEHAPQGAIIDGEAAGLAFQSQPVSRTPQPDCNTALAALQSRIPESITNPNFELPEESNNANDYAPLLGMDLVPHTRAIPTLPLASPNLDTHFQTQFTHLTDTVVNLRHDIDQENPDSLSTLKPGKDPNEPDLGSDVEPNEATNEEPEDEQENEQEVIREFESILNASPNSSLIIHHSSLPRPPDPNLRSP